MAEGQKMNSRTRLIVLSISAPVIVFTLVGGVLGRVLAREDTTYQNLRLFSEVTGLITSNYVEDVNVDKVMHGAMHGLADALDPDSAYLSPSEAKAVESGAPVPAGDVGLDLTRQYYLRVIAARDNSPAAKAGLRTGDYLRTIDDMPTRDMSVWEGMRALRGAPGSKVKLVVIRGSAVDPHIVELTRETPGGPDVTGRIAAPGVGYLRIVTFGPKTADQINSEVAALSKNGASKLVIDVRRTAGGALDNGVASARLFLATGTLTIRESKGAERETVSAASGDGSITLPTAVLIDTGTSGAAELFAAALEGNKRAELIGERTIGRAAAQRLIKLPDGSALWLSTTRYLTPAGNALHEKGLEPTIPVDEPDGADFGQPPPAGDPILDKALELFAQKKAA